MAKLKKEKKEKRISFEEGLKLVESIKKKIDQFKKSNNSVPSSHEYSF